MKKTRGASVIFFNSKGQVLLFLRDNKEGIPFPNYWDLLGGHVEEGETPQQCIIREMKEEIELDLEKYNLFKTYTFDDREEFVFFRNMDINIITTHLNEGQELRWFTEAEIKAMPADGIAFGFRNIILEFYSNIGLKRHG